MKGDGIVNDELKALLARIHTRPALYIGFPSLSRLLDYVYGYIDCMHVRDGKIPAFLPYDFYDYVLEYYGIEHSIRSLSDTMRFFESSEEDAFERFFVLLEEAWARESDKEIKK